MLTSEWLRLCLVHVSHWGLNSGPPACQAGTLQSALGLCPFLQAPRVFASPLQSAIFLLTSVPPQEPDSDNEWQQLLESSEPVPIQLKAPLTLICNPDFCQHIQTQLQETGGQVRPFQRKEERHYPFSVTAEAICSFQGGLPTSFISHTPQYSGSAPSSLYEEHS